MDAHVFRLVAQELTLYMRGARVEKIHSPAPGLLQLALYNHSLKRQLILRHDKVQSPGQNKLVSVRRAGQSPCLYLSGQKLPNPQIPYPLVMTLRRHLADRRLGAATVDWLNRRIYFSAPQIKQTDYPLWFCLDLANGPGLSPEPPALEEPVWPDPALLLGDHATILNDPNFWRKYPVLTPFLRKTLLRLSGPEAAALLADLQHDAENSRGVLLQYGLDGVTHFLSPWPLPQDFAPGMNALEESELPAPDPAKASFPALEASRLMYEPEVLKDLGMVLHKDTRQAQSSAEKRLKKSLKVLDEEEARLRGLLKLRDDARIIQASLWRFAADQKLPTLELSADDSPDGIPHAIRLDPLKTVRENMARLFKQADKGERGLKFLAARRSTLQAELQLAQAGVDTPRIKPAQTSAAQKDKKRGKEAVTAKAAKLVQTFISSDGFAVLRGRSAEGNQALLKLAKPHDIWLHVEGGPSAHVVIRREHMGVDVPERTLAEAAVLSAVKSWRKNDAKAEVMLALVKDVRPLKGGAPGSVLVDKTIRSIMIGLDHELEEKLRPRLEEI